MANKEPLKKNLSSMQVLKTLQLLLEGNYTMQELVDNLNTKEKDAIFNNSVISKYINTCRYLGIEIPKIHNKYYVTKLPFGLNLTDIDINLLKNLYNTAKDELTSSYFKSFDSLIVKFNRFINKKIVRVDKGTYQFACEVFEQAIKRKRKVNLLFKNNLKLECIPLGIVDTNNKIYFKIYSKRERMIDWGRLSGVEILQENYNYPYKNKQIVTYALKNKLAYRYELRENEKLESFDDGIKVISIKDEPQEELFSRLLRYGADCEILSPKTCRDEIKQFLEDTLANYGV